MKIDPELSRGIASGQYTKQEAASVALRSMMDKFKVTVIVLAPNSSLRSVTLDRSTLEAMPEYRSFLEMIQKASLINQEQAPQRAESPAPQSQPTKQPPPQKVQVYIQNKKITQLTVTGSTGSQVITGQALAAINDEFEQLLARMVSVAGKSQVATTTKPSDETSKKVVVAALVDVRMDGTPEPSNPKARALFMELINFKTYIDAEEEIVNEYAESARKAQEKRSEAEEEEIERASLKRDDLKHEEANESAKRIMELSQELGWDPGTVPELLKDHADKFRAFLVQTLNIPS